MQPFRTICASCAELLVSPAITEPHQHMTAHYKQSSPDGPREGEYTCLECESVWKLSFANSTIEKAELVTHNGARVSNALPDCPEPFECSGNFASCPLLVSSPPC